MASGQRESETPGEEMIVTPGILIGSDFYWQLMGDRAPQRLVDNLYCISTKVGSMIGGRIGNYQEPSDVIAAHVRGEVKPTEDMWHDVEKSMNLRAWASNDQTVMDQFSTEDRIPRKINMQGGSSQLHVFVDASQHAFAAAVYLRTVSQNIVKNELVLSTSNIAAEVAAISEVETTAELVDGSPATSSGIGYSG
ncbi:unnamed protein product [Toxocara canis]|uniref:DUF1758 domain-containing protein n=1 Tax=Toxocara canis TaxID=6265 RepID=A0A183VGF8_TOXCA|nr:unnamed protein product [Toxocara canis]